MIAAVEGRDGSADFDFIHGAWRARRRKLRGRLAGCRGWMLFDGTVEAEPILSGLGNFARNVLDQPEDPYEACTLRLFDLPSGQARCTGSTGATPRRTRGCTGASSIASARSPAKIFALHGDPLALRMEGVDPRHRALAFSDDGRASRETNWIMEFTRP